MTATQLPSHRFEAGKLKDKFDDFDNFMDGIAPKPTSIIKPTKVLPLRRKPSIAEGSCYFDSTPLETEKSPIRKKTPEKPHSSVLEQVISGPSGGGLMSPTARARAIQAKRKSDEANRKGFFAARLRRGTIKGILAACEEDCAAASEVAPICSLKSVKKEEEKTAKGKNKKKKKPGAKTKVVIGPDGKPVKKKKKKKKKETENGEHDENGKGKIEKNPNSPKKKKKKKKVTENGEWGKPDQAEKEEGEASQPLVPSRPVDRHLPPPMAASTPPPGSPVKAATFSTIDGQEAKIVIELDANAINPEALTALLSQVGVDQSSIHGVDDQSQHSRQSKQSLSERTDNAQTVQPNRQSLPNRRANRLPPTGLPRTNLKPNLTSPRYKRSSAGDDSGRSELSQDSPSKHKRKAISGDSTRSERSADDRRHPLPRQSSDPSSDWSAGRLRRSELSQSRHRRDLSQSRHRRDLSQSRHRRDLSQSRHMRDLSESRRRRRSHSAHAGPRNRDSSLHKSVSLEEEAIRDLVSPRPQTKSSSCTDPGSSPTASKDRGRRRDSSQSRHRRDLSQSRHMRDLSESRRRRRSHSAHAGPRNRDSSLHKSVSLEEEAIRDLVSPRSQTKSSSCTDSDSSPTESKDRGRRRDSSQSRHRHDHSESRHRRDHSESRHRRRSHSAHAGPRNITRSTLQPAE